VVDWVLWYGHDFFSMSSNTLGPRGAARGPFRAGSTARASSPSSSRPCARASRPVFLPFLPRVCFCWGSFDLLPSAGASSMRLTFLPSKMAPTASSPEEKLVAMSNSLLESTGGLRPSSRTRSRQVVPSRKACTISDWAMLGSSVQHLEKHRMKSRSDSSGFWVHARRSQEFLGRTYVPWKFPMNVCTRSSQLWIWLGGRCSSHVRAESARCSGRLRMMTSSVVAPPSWHARR
jgi:hypothetical protein